MQIQVYFEMAKDSNRPNKLAMKIKAGFNYNSKSGPCNTQPCMNEEV